MAILRYGPWQSGFDAVDEPVTISSSSPTPVLCGDTRWSGETYDCIAQEGGGPIGGGNDGQGGNVGAPVQIDNPQNPSLSAEFEAQKLKIEKLDRESQVKSVDKMIYEQEMAKRLVEQEKMQEKYRLEQLAKNIK